jgi:hypothetical protein
LSEIGACMLVYQEWLRTRPWDIILAAGVITTAAGVPMVVAIGTWWQNRRAGPQEAATEEGRPRLR